MVTYYNKKDLIRFGNFLLSKERKANLKNKVNETNVTDSDIANFLESIKKID